MIGKEFMFKPVEFRPWQGRYSRIVGKTTALRIRHTSEKGVWPVIEWDYDEGRVISLAVEQGEVQKLVDAVMGAKQKMNGNFGGAFVINEFGQVIVPSSAGDGTRLLVGETDGVLLFDNPLTDEVIDMSQDEGLEPGDVWDKPYIGIQYNLTRGSSIYFWGGSESQYPSQQDKELISKLRAVRRTGPVRFLVNPYGIVLTKAPAGNFDPEREETWQPVYVGRINKNKWFAKEE